MILRTPKIEFSFKGVYISCKSIEDFMSNKWFWLGVGWLIEFTCNWIHATNDKTKVYMANE